MSSPYRSGPGKKAPDVAPEPGLVDEMVRQFADAHAFLRELVQNGIDAGSTRLIVTVDRDGDGVVRTAVEDDGSGMTRAIIEGPLLTLFQSSKETDSTKIGKYGVGFLSVFATKPERVEVRTRTAGEAWIVTLFPDHSFELARDDERLAGTGTIVTLVHTMDGDAYAHHVQRVAASLSRWCRYAHVPVVLDGRAINEEFAIEALATASLEENGARYVVGVGTGTSIGFYNRGLTLFETEAPEVGLDGVHVKIDTPSLAHTLSRDNVRRDAELARVLRRAIALVRGKLWETLEQRIVAAADDVAVAADGPRVALLASLYEAAAAPAFGNREYGSIAVPLVDPHEGRRVVAIGSLLKASPAVVATAHTSSAVTRALTARGTMVVRSASLMAPLRRFTAGRPFHDAESSWVYATTADVTEHPEDAALLDEVVRLLDRTRRSLADAVLARFEGGTTGARYRVAKVKTGEAFLGTVHATDAPWSSRSTLFLDVEDASVRLARRRAKTDPHVAAYLLVRAVLLVEGAIAAPDVDRLLAAAGERAHA